MTPGPKYTALRLTAHLAVEGMAPSLDSAEDTYANCLAEAIIGLYKTQCIRPTCS